MLVSVTPTDDTTGRGGTLADAVVISRGPRLPVPATRDYSWRDHAACRGLGTGPFFPSKDAPRVPDGVKGICEACPVRHPCLIEALVHRERGIWGGTTERERAALRRRYRRASCPVCGPAPLVDFDGRQACLLCGLSWLAVQARTAAGIIRVEAERVDETPLELQDGEPVSLSPVSC